jgi:hypothetical protein
MRSISRLVLSTLALVLLLAGSFNLNRTSANVPAGVCMDYCGCPGGTRVCCSFSLPDGTQITCFCNDDCG